MSDGATVGSLLETLGASIFDVVAASSGTGARVSHVTIVDPTEDANPGPAELLLAVGFSPSETAILDLTARAGRAGAAAVAIKLRGAVPARLLEAADSAGIALLAVTPEITWAQVHALLRTAITSAGVEAETNGASIGLGDLFSLANAVSAMVGGAVTIEDPHSRVLAYSSLDGPIDDARRQTILERRVPNEWVQQLTAAGIFRQLWSSEGVIRVELANPDGTRLRNRLAIAVRAGKEILGSIWVGEGDQPFDAGAEEALRQAAHIASLHLVRHQVGEDLERRLRGDTLRAVLDGRGPLDVLAGRLGLEVASRFAVVAFELQAEDDAALVLQRERALGFVSLYCEAFRRRAVQVPIGRTIYALLPLTKPDLAPLVQLAEHVLERGRDVLAADLHIGIGSPVEHLRDVPWSRAQADRVLRVLGGKQRDRLVGTIDDVRAQALLLELGDLFDERPHLRAGKLDLLLEQDRKAGGALLETLEAYLAAFGDIPAAAQRIGTHPNTFRYRLRRVCELANLDLTDPDERLAIELQLRFR